MFPNNMYLLIWHLLFLWCDGVLSDYGECTTRGLLGSCQLIRNCYYAQDLLRSRQNPDHCGFEGNEPVVCCPHYHNPAKIPAKPSLEQVPQTSTEISLSEKKCEQFYPELDFHAVVIGGVKSLAEEFPHMAIIGYGEEKDILWGCGGSLISLNFVLTAAHCLETEFGVANWVRLGDLDLSTNSDVAAPQNFTVKRRILHPGYHPPKRYNDIAILELDRDVVLTLFVSPACLPTEKTPIMPRMTASGWGNKGYIGESSNYLLKVELDTVDFEKCRKTFQSTSRRFLPNGILNESQICAGGVIGKDTCQGDSGGPLQVKNTERTFSVNVHTLIGVTSFGKACGLSATPGVYSRVAFYVPWIESVIWPNEH